MEVSRIGIVYPISSSNHARGLQAFGVELDTWFPGTKLRSNRCEVRAELHQFQPIHRRTAAHPIVLSNYATFTLKQIIVL